MAGKVNATFRELRTAEVAGFLNQHQGYKASATKSISTGRLAERLEGNIDPANGMVSLANFDSLSTADKVRYRVVQEIARPGTDGFVSLPISEVMQVEKRAGWLISYTLTNAMEAADLDKNGRISFEEFQSMSPQFRNEYRGVIEGMDSLARDQLVKGALSVAAAVGLALLFL